MGVALGTNLLESVVKEHSTDAFAPVFWCDPEVQNCAER